MTCLRQPPRFLMILAVHMLWIGLCDSPNGDFLQADDQVVRRETENGGAREAATSLPAARPAGGFAEMPVTGIWQLRSSATWEADASAGHSDSGDSLPPSIASERDTPPPHAAHRLIGHVRIDEPGEYHFAVTTSAAVQVRLGDNHFARARRPSSDAQSSTPFAFSVELPVGEHPLSVEFATTSVSQSVHVLWRGPGFGWELLRYPYWGSDDTMSVHEPALRGELLVRAHRCGACHELPDQIPILEVPQLQNDSPWLQRDWLEEWLHDPQADDGESDRQAPLPDAGPSASSGDAASNARELQALSGPAAAEAGANSRNMPHFVLSSAERRLLAQFLAGPAPSQLRAPDRATQATLDRNSHPPEAASPSNSTSAAAAVPSTTQGATDDARPATSHEGVDGAQQQLIIAGERIFVERGCLACHEGTLSIDRGAVSPDELADDEESEPPVDRWAQQFGGGSLERIAEKRSVTYLRQWLVEPASLQALHRMPRFDLTETERESLVAYLATRHRPLRPRSSRADDDPLDADQRANLLAATKLWDRFRCGACHVWQAGVSKDAGDSSDRDAVSRTDAAEHTRRNSRRKWTNWPAGDTCVDAPQATRPGYRLNRADRDAIRAYWQQLPDEGPVSRSRVTHGAARRLVELNCWACHARASHPGLRRVMSAVIARFPEFASSIDTLIPPTLDGVGDKRTTVALRQSLAGAPTAAPLRPWLSVRMPQYRLTEEERMSLVDWFVGLDRIDDDMIPSHANDLVHQLDRPSSDAAGLGQGAERRTRADWLHAGTRLVTSEGFGCASCHAIGGSLPERSLPGTRGPQLSLLSERVRSEWFRRFVRQPARMVARMEMPSIQLPVQGVLGDDLSSQIDAVWNVLNDPQFKLPAAQPVRVLRQVGRPEGEHTDWQIPRSLLVIDGLRFEAQRIRHALLVGFGHRHNFVYDLDQARLVGWTIGDTARQYAEGKAWVWEVAGTPLGSGLNGHNDSVAALSPPPGIRERSRAIATQEVEWIERESPAASKSRVQAADESNEQAELPESVDPAPQPRMPRRLVWDAIRHVGASVEWTYRLEPTAADGLVVQVTRRLVERWTPWVRGDESGVTREIRILNPRATDVFRWRPTLLFRGDAGTAETSTVGWTTSEQPNTWIHPTADGAIRVRLPAHARYDAATESFVIPGDGFHVGAQGQTTSVDAPASQAMWVLEYATRISPDRFAPTTKHPPLVPSPIPLTGVPGFRATRVPFDSQIMPTALAWTSKSDMIVASLKGEVWRGRDGDGDKIPDQWQPCSDQLATPYGIQPVAQGLDVLTKFGLVRLTDPDDHGHFQQITQVASGWGFTDDYHDWAVGLPRDAQGNYYVALPCQQDERPVADARWRGRVIRLESLSGAQVMPRPDLFTDGSDVGPCYQIVEISAGHRFPMGLAMNQQGALFVTDNQGNYNPYNELNHVQSGRHFGFINRLERGFPPPAQVAKPAVQVPHPWTRSVNGICFLESPDTGVAQSRSPFFGPWQGHLLGCEYDTRRLVRMSLQWIDRECQGAVYPLSRSDEVDASSLLGPIQAAVAPDGSIFVGSLRDSGWGGANNIGELVRLEFDQRDLPHGIAEVTALTQGIRIEFTRPLDKSSLANSQHYEIQSAYRIATPEYGGEDQDRRTERISSISVEGDGRVAELTIDDFRPGRVYEVRVRDAITEGSEKSAADRSSKATNRPHAVLFPAEAYLTVHRLPRVDAGGK